MAKPIILLTLQHELSDDRLWLADAYANAIALCGGIPLALPPLPLSLLPETVACADGILLTGGPDVDPILYGEERSPLCGSISDKRDTLEVTLARLAIRQGLPLFGICRGIQVMNVAMGGTLIQHTPLHSGDCKEGRRFHAVLVGHKRYRVNSRHHQVLDRAADVFRVFARDENGDIEGICLPGHPFAVGVQWHPEEMLPDEPLSLSLFLRFIEASSRRRQDRESGWPSASEQPQARFSS